MITITNEVYEAAVSNTDNIKICQNVVGHYGRSLSKDEYRECYLDAVWKSLKNFIPGKSKFTTFLHLNMGFEIRRRLFNHKKEQKYQNNVDLEKLIVEPKECMTEYCTESEIDLYQQRFIERKTIAEIAKTENLSSVTIINRLEKIKDRIRETVY